MLKLLAAAILLAPATCAAPLAIAAAAQRPAPIGPTPDETLRCQLMMNPNPEPLPLMRAPELNRWRTEKYL